jgi:hypothetical protein
MSERQQKTAVRVASAPTEEFEAAVESEHPPSITHLAKKGPSRISAGLKLPRKRGSDAELGPILRPEPPCGAWVGLSKRFVETYENTLVIAL